MDQITVEVIRNSAVFISEEMGVVLRDTSFSPNIKDRLDHSCAVLNEDGDLVAQAEHIPVHLGSMSIGVRNLVDYLAREGIELGPGDVALTNNPYISGTHLNDLMTLKPVYHEGRLIAYVANKAHHVDVGGVVPGSIGVGARELREEGLVIEPVKIVDGGRIRWDLVKLLEANVRTPRYFRGDLMAQIASLNVGEARLKELASKYGGKVLVEAWSSILEYTEKYTRARIREVSGNATGTYTAEDYLETIEGGLARIKATLTISGDEIKVDYTGTSNQVGEPINAVYGVTVASTVYALKTTIDPDMPMNQGFFKPVTITAPEGTIVNPIKPAPVGGGNVETSQRIADVVYKALAQALPGRVPAASCGTMSNVIVGGRGWAFYETNACGSGARPCCDGVDGVHTNMTNTLNTPIEVIEREYPVIFRKYEFRPNSGGPGTYRGGIGIIRSFTILEDDVTVTIFAERGKTRPWGLEGGKPGAGFKATLEREGVVEDLGAKKTIKTRRGDTITIYTPGGGGYGDPCKRSKEQVERDLKEGRITIDEAENNYCTRTRT